MEQKYITIGSLKITVQAFTLFIAGVVTSIAVVIIMPKAWLVSLLIIALSAIGAYVINCTIEGKCIIYAWTITIIALIYFCFVIFLVIKERISLSRAAAGPVYNMNVTTSAKPATSQVATQAPNAPIQTNSKPTQTNTRM